LPNRVVQSIGLSEVLCNQSLESGFERWKGGGIITPIFQTVKPMTQEPSTLYAKLLGETASITWKELQPFFAKGALLWVEPSQDLIAVAGGFCRECRGESGCVAEHGGGREGL
jgi:hypothetical protein